MTQIQIATRREFLVQGLGVVGVGASLPNFLIRTALAGPAAKAGERILVVLQLSGGNDGLSTVVPLQNDDYARNRTTTRIAAGDAVKLDDDFGLHPNLKPFRELLDQHAFAAVHGVGYPNPNRSHFKSMDIWHLADNSGKPVSEGWIGRYCDHAFRGKQDPTLVVAVGGEKAPLAVQGKEHTGINLARPELYRFLGEQDGRVGQAYRKLSRPPGADAMENSGLDFVSRTAVDANASSDTIRKLVGARRSPVAYPVSRLAGSLQTVAALIAGGLSARVYYVFQSGFDTHAGQKQRHDRLMTEFSEAVAAFQKDLAHQNNADRVLTMSFSEFGRRVRENGSQGTDHGTAGPMFLFGPKVKPGLHGQHPSLAAADLDQGDLKHRVDFRAVYATVLEKWLGTPAEPVLGHRYSLLDLVV
jgi:uncharacterized protein (DUF1501 family)